MVHRRIHPNKALKGWSLVSAGLSVDDPAADMIAWAVLVRILCGSHYCSLSGMLVQDSFNKKSHIHGSKVLTAKCSAACGENGTVGSEDILPGDGLSTISSPTIFSQDPGIHWLMVRGWESDSSGEGTGTSVGAIGTSKLSPQCGRQHPWSTM